MKNKKPKYFPNNWKVMGWVLPSSVACVIREERDGKITEKIYSQSHAANNYLTKEMSDKKNTTIYTIADEHQVIQHHAFVPNVKQSKQLAHHLRL